MKQYLDLLQKILDEGREKESGRTNMPNTWGIEHGLIEMDLTKGFPLLTTKKMFWKGIIHELLWFLRGETNIKYLVDNGVDIWNGDAYRWYLQEHAKYLVNTTIDEHDLVKPYTMEEFINLIKNGEFTQSITSRDIRKYVLGDLGKVYGYQWRNQNGVDQIKDILDGLKSNPWSRYHILDGWNKADFPEMALPPCHLLYQFIVRPLSLDERISLGNNVPEFVEDCMNDDKRGISSNYTALCNIHNIPKFYLNVNMYQRSCDTFLGVPFNIASMSLLLMIFAKASNMIPKMSRWIGGDVHLYMDHIPVVKEQLTREPLNLPEMIIKKDLSTLEDILDLTINDFELKGYTSYEKLKGELFTGNAK